MVLLLTTFRQSGKIGFNQVLANTPKTSMTIQKIQYLLPQAEHGDYYSHSDMEPTGFLKGKRLRSFLQKRKLAD
jgi:hypothetical protein